MRTYIAPNGESIIVPDGRVVTYGLTDEQNETVRSCLPAQGYELYEADIDSDLIAVPAGVLIILAAALDTDAQEMIFDYYTEIGDCSDETVFWIGNPKPPHNLRARYKCYESFEELAADMKYLLLSAFKKSKEAKAFSWKMVNCLQVLSLIRKNPGIKTQEIAKEVEISVRTVQRYIVTLQAAGEWIEYDTAKKGWQLQYGKSVLFGDV